MRRVVNSVNKQYESANLIKANFKGRYSGCRLKQSLLNMFLAWARLEKCTEYTEIFRTINHFALIYHHNYENVDKTNMHEEIYVQNADKTNIYQIFSMENEI